MNRVCAILVLGALAIVASCSTPPRPALAPPAPAAPPVPLQNAATNDVAPAPTIGWIVPPTGMHAPMPGAPRGAELAQSRLVAATCATNQAAIDARVAQQIAQMRAQLASRYEEWKALPRCEERGITWDIAYA
jgi:hypothetical protein